MNSSAVSNATSTPARRLRIAVPWAARAAPTDDVQTPEADLEH